MKRRDRVFFSFRSPFSWLAIERLRRQLPDAHERLEFIPYWEPDAETSQALMKRNVTIRYEPMSKAKHLYILQDTKRLAESLGLRIAWPVDVDPWWELAHLGWLLARRLGAGPSFYTAVVEARWHRGENISRAEVVSAIACAAGLDGAAIINAVNDPEIRAEAVECLADAYNDDIFGVPYFRAGGDRYWGFDRVDSFVVRVRGSATTADALQGIPAEVRGTPGVYDTDTAGGCG
jgi:2-hydroxychromene-2-carboxylate isomerase